MNMKTIPADELVIGSQFVPPGKKRPVEILRIGDNTPGRLELMCTSPQGNSVVFVSRYATVAAVIPNPCDRVIAARASRNQAGNP